ncbi:MAG TPA: DUF3108 domain-containing protein [Aliidongia sp.]|uniref:DUF3108 domain-containing protein n=1 Tax=Aliidongia sp. TaxID=1914230 RepID=UPI002DDDB34E|nr:DUF3108 domain-containing protein [Aliidongia sp.]HEV2676234.1 DUF3108 domain-containing protein [Aliidongia sp.]
MGLMGLGRMAWGRTGAGLLMAAGLATAPSWAEDATPMDLSYDLSLGGLTIMSFELGVRTANDRYVLDFSGRTRGMLSLLGSGYVVSSSQGRLLPGGEPQPEVFVSHSDGNEGERRAQIRYGAQGPTSWTAEPKPGSDGEELTPIPPDSIPGTRDILAALLDFAGTLGRGESCEHLIRIFDGRRRFDLKFTDRGREIVAPEGEGFYAGPAQHCHLDLVRIGGYSTDPTKYLSGNDAEFWLAPVLPNEPPVPVEIIFKGRLGVMHARLTIARHGAEVRGAPMQKPQSAAVPAHDEPVR